MDLIQLLLLLGKTSFATLIIKHKVSDSDQTSMINCIRAYDRAAIRFRGVEADINFTHTDYADMNQVPFLVFSFPISDLLL